MEKFTVALLASAVCVFPTRNYINMSKPSGWDHEKDESVRIVSERL